MTPEPEIPIHEVRTRAVRGVASLLLRQGAVTFIAMAGLLVLARIITPEMFGLFVTAQLAQMICEQLGGLGLVATLVRNREPVGERELRTAFTLQLGASAAAAVLVGLAAPAVLAFLGIDVRHQWMVWVMALCGVITAFQTVPSVILQRSLTFERLAMSQVAQQLTYQATAVVLAFAGFGAGALVAAAVAKSVAGAVTLAAFAPWSPRLGIDRAAVGRMLRFGVLVQLSSAAGIANNSTVPVMVGYALGTAAVGQVNFARRLLDAIGYQPLILAGQVQLRVFGRIQDDPRLLLRSLERSVLVGGALVLGLLALLAALAHPIVHFVFTDKWLPAVPVLQLLCLGYAMHVILYPVVQLQKAIGDSATPLASSVVRFVAEASLFLALADGLDLAAYGVAYVLANAGSLAYALRRLPPGLRPDLAGSMLPVVLAALAAGAVSWFLAGQAEQLPLAFAGLLAGLATFFVVLGVLCGSRMGREWGSLIGSVSPAMASPNGVAARIGRGLEKLDHRAWGWNA